MKINEVEAQVGITKKNIRFYEEQGLLSPRRNSENGYRDYGPEEVETLRQIKLLRKLGVDDDMARKAMRRQVALYFFIPLALALVHSAVAIYVVNQMIIELNVENSLISILFSAGILLVLYGLYYIATYQSCKGMIRERT